MENAFYFTLKALCVREIFKFLSRLFGHVEKGLVKKLGFKIYDVIYWETNNFSHVMPNISRSNDN